MWGNYLLGGGLCSLIVFFLFQMACYCYNNTAF